LLPDCLAIPYISSSLVSINTNNSHRAILGNKSKNMFYEKYSKLCISCAIFCLSAYIFSPEKGMKVSIAEVSAKEATTTTGSTATGVSIRLSDE